MCPSHADWCLSTKDWSTLKFDGQQLGHAVASGLWAAGMISIILSYLILSYHHHHHHHHRHHHHHHQHHHHHHRRRRRRRRRHRLQGNSR